MSRAPLDEAAVAMAQKCLSFLKEMRATEERFGLSVNTYYGEVDVKTCELGAFEYDEDFSFWLPRGKDVKPDQYWVKKSDAGDYVLCNIPHPGDVLWDEPHESLVLP